MKKYDTPSIKLSSFTGERIVTGSADLSEYVGEVQTILGPMTESEYKARIEKFGDMLKFQ